MTDDASNDNLGSRAAKKRPPDPHGEAAALLVESLIHALVAKSVISVADAVEIVDIAVDVKTNGSAELVDGRANRAESVALLQAIGQSLARDLP